MTNTHTEQFEAEWTAARGRTNTIGDIRIVLPESNTKGMKLIDRLAVLSTMHSDTIIEASEFECLLVLGCVSDIAKTHIANLTHVSAETRKTALLMLSDYVAIIEKMLTVQPAHYMAICHGFPTANSFYFDGVVTKLVNPVDISNTGSAYGLIQLDTAFLVIDYFYEHVVTNGKYPANPLVEMGKWSKWLSLACILSTMYMHDEQSIKLALANAKQIDTWISLSNVKG